MLKTPSLSPTTPPSAAGLIEAKGQKTAEFSPFSVFLDLNAVAQSGAEAEEAASAHIAGLALDIAVQLPDPGNAGGKILPVSLPVLTAASDQVGTSASEAHDAAVDLPRSGAASPSGSGIAITGEGAVRRSIAFTQSIAPDVPDADFAARVPKDSAPTSRIVQGPKPAQREQGDTQALIAMTALRTLSAVEAAKSGQAVNGNTILVRSADAAKPVTLDTASAPRDGAPMGLSVTIIAETTSAAALATHSVLAGATPRAPLAQPPVQTSRTADQTAPSPTAADPELAGPDGDAGTDAPRAKTASTAITAREAVQLDTPRPAAMDARPEGVLSEARPQSATPSPSIANTAARAQNQAPLEFGTLVERLAEAREAATPHAVRTAVRHAEFGVVNMQFRADDARLNVTMNSADPDFAPAVQAASAAAQSGSANDSGQQTGPRQDAQAQGRQTDTTSQSDNSSQSGTHNGGREDGRTRVSQNRTVASGTGQTGHKTDGDSAPGGGIYA